MTCKKIVPVGQEEERTADNIISIQLNLPLAYNKKRHLEQIEGINCISQSWRMKERMKTVSVALVLCLNVGVDPPDVVKIQPCAKLECWIDTSSVSAAKALELVGANLQQQYERWQPRARYKQSLDPTVDDVKKLCTSLRRNAKEERVLFHYNGHGVPRPTVNGEIWVFNRNYTQYIPLSIYDLQTWMGAPSIYVYDCSNAGIIVNSFNTFAEQHEREFEKNAQTTGSRKSPSLSGGTSGSNMNAMGDGGAPINHAISYKNCIQLAACAANQILPMNPQLPADLFTACLTTPIKIALKWFMLQQTASLVPHVSYDLIERIPGKINDRRTMQGELNWIFTAITDTIAWNTLPRDLFQKLFRQDLLVASLFRNFLLAERILRSYDCTPIASPALPPSFRHPMWSAWDLSLDVALSQLPDILQNKQAYVHSSFFEEQLTAFQVWLEGSSEKRSPPEQLPIVLQVLLSQVHRYRALELLGRFLDLGPWAVNLALSVGIFPYVLKLLQSSAKELRPFLVFIWAKILAVDSTCQIDLIREQGHKYFLEALQDPTQTIVFNNSYRMFAAFVLASIVHNFPLGQSSALQGKLISFCLIQLSEPNAMMRQWLAICLGNLWQNYEEARWSGVRDLAHEKLYPLLQDTVPEVRAAAVYALGTFISSVESRTEHANNIDRAVALQLLTAVGYDVSPLVRMELIKALQWMVIIFESSFVSIYLKEAVTGNGSGGGGHHSFQTSSLERMKRVSSSSSIMNIEHRQSVAAAVAIGTSNLASSGSSWLYTPSINVSIYMRFWQFFYRMSHDPYPQVARLAQKVIEHIRQQATTFIQAKEAINAELNNTIRHSNPSLSVSLPPSPNTRTSYLTGNPSSNMVNAEVLAAKMQSSHPTAIDGRANIVASSPPWRGSKPQTSSPKPANSPGAGSATTLKMRAHHQGIQLNEETTAHNIRNLNAANLQAAAGIAAAGSGRLSGGDSSSSKLKPIITTNFIDWSISFIARPSKYFCDLINDTTDGGSSSSSFTNYYTNTLSRNYRQASTFQYQHQQYDQHNTSSSSAANFSLDTSVDEVDRSWCDMNSSLSSDCEDLSIRYQDLQDDYRRQRDCSVDSAYLPRLEHSWGGRTQMTPNLVKLHPFQTEIAVAYRDKVMMSNWSTGVIQSFLPTRQPFSPRHLTLPGGMGSSSSNISTSHHYVMSSSPDNRRSSQPHYTGEGGGIGGSSGNLAPISNGYVTSIDFVNPHYRTLLMVSHSDYIVRIWRQMAHQACNATSTCDKFTSNDDDHLVTAWVAFSEQTDLVRPTTLCGGNFITQWHQRTNTAFAGGVTKFIRLWNAEKEMKEVDYPAGSDHPISLISCPVNEVNLFATGYGDGCVRLFDRRLAPSEAKVMSYHEHGDSLIELCMKNDGYTIISACGMGNIRIFDIRKPMSVHQWTAVDRPATINVHPELNFIACGKQSINIHDTNGRQLTTVRSNEGFRSSRMALTTCLSFHPYRMCLASGFADHTVSVFTAAPRV